MFCRFVISSGINKKVLLNVKVGAPPVCVRRRPILSCEDAEEEAEPGRTTLVRVVVLGGDRELGRLARAYARLQRTERRAPRLTRRCRLQFFFAPMQRTPGSAGEGPLTATPTSVRVLVTNILKHD